MQGELSRVFSQTLRQMNGGEEEFMQGMEEHLKQKQLELKRLQYCFQSEIKQIQTYEKKQNVYKRVINMILMTFGYFKNQLESIKELVNHIQEWKQQLTLNLKTLPSIVAKAFESKIIDTDQNMVKSRVQINQNQFKRIQMRYRDQIQKQSQTILQLENALKTKSLSKNKFSQPNLIRQHPSHIKSHDVEHLMINNKRPSPLKELKPARKNSNLRDRSISPVRIKNTDKILNKQQVVQKIRKYQQNKTKRQNINPFQKKANQNEKNQEPFFIPALPQLRMAQNINPPISSGFQILVVDGKELYKGMWKRGRFQGRGKYYSDHWVYDGQFKGGSIQGFGTLNFKGCTFIGKFENGQAQGEGTLYCKQRPVSGVWKDNVLIKQY